MFRKLLLLALALGSIGSAFAQGLPSAPHLTISQRSAFLLMDLETRELLKLSAAQSAGILKAIQTHAKATTAIFKQKEPDEKLLVSADQAFAKTSWSLLDALQQKTLLKAALSEVGVHALADKEVSDRLKLTKDQLGQILPILQEMRKRTEDFNEMIAKGFEHLLPPKNEEEEKAQREEKAKILASYRAQRGLLDEEQKKSESKILAILTPAQQEQWKVLTAEG